MGEAQVWVSQANWRKAGLGCWEQGEREVLGGAAGPRSRMGDSSGVREGKPPCPRMCLVHLQNRDTMS